jgi:hypothetical protein
VPTSNEEDDPQPPAPFALPSEPTPMPETLPLRLRSPPTVAASWAATRRPSRAAVAEPPLPHLRTDLRAALRPPRRRRLYSGRCVDIVPPTQPARRHHWPPRHQPPHGRKRHSGCRVTDEAGALTARAAATPEPDRRPATALPPRATAPPQWPCHGRHAVARARAVAAPTRFGGGRAGSTASTRCPAIFASNR